MATHSPDDSFVLLFSPPFFFCLRVQLTAFPTFPFLFSFQSCFGRTVDAPLVKTCRAITHPAFKDVCPPHAPSDLGLPSLVRSRFLPTFAKAPLLHPNALFHCLLSAPSPLGSLSLLFIPQPRFSFPFHTCHCHCLISPGSPLCA